MSRRATLTTVQTKNQIITSKSIEFPSKKPQKAGEKNLQSFYLTLDEVMLKRLKPRSMMNGVGVNKTDCPKENQMTFSVPARSKTSHVFPFEQA